MRRTAFDETRDQHIASEVTSERSLQCAAPGCPNRWSVDGEAGRTCSAHAWADRRDWPRVTREQLDHQVERARYGAAERAGEAHARLTLANKRAILQRLSTVATHKPGRAWAADLRERELRGETLTLTARRMWRSVIREPQHHGEAFDGQEHRDV